MTGTAPLPARTAAPDGPTVAIALGGGGARGLAHIHVIEALDELGIRPVLVSGSSIGAIMGAALASGMKGRDIRAHTLAAVGRRADVLNRLWSLRPASLSDALTTGFRVGQFNLERVLKAFLPDTIPARFEDLSLPLKIVAADYFGQREHVCESGDLICALAASAALPAIFRPVRIGGRVMIDGGLWNPVPFDHILGAADITIGIDVVGRPQGESGTMPNRIDSLYGASQLTMHAIIEAKLKICPPHIFLQPDVGRFRVLDFLKAGEILAVSAGVRDELKRALDREFERCAKSAPAEE